MKRTTVSHRRMFRHLCENLDHRLDSPECRAIRTHLAGCPECLDYLQSLKTTVALFRKYEPPRMPAEVRKRLTSLAGKKRAPARRKRRS